MRRYHTTIPWTKMAARHQTTPMNPLAQTMTIDSTTKNKNSQRLFFVKKSGTGWDSMDQISSNLSTRNGSSIKRSSSELKSVSIGGEEMEIESVWDLHIPLACFEDILNHEECLFNH